MEEGEDCWGQAVHINESLGALSFVSAPLPWQAVLYQGTGKISKCLGVLVGWGVSFNLSADVLE